MNLENYLKKFKLRFIAWESFPFAIGNSKSDAATICPQIIWENNLDLFTWECLWIILNNEGKSGMLMQ